MQHLVHPSSAMLPTQAINRTISLCCLVNEKSMRVVFVDVIGSIGVKVCNTLLPVGIEGSISLELGTWES